MTNKPYRRRTKSSPRVRELAHGALAKLFDIEPFHRNELNIKQLNRLRDMIDQSGLRKAAERIGVDRQCVLFACAGFGHRLQPKTAARIREFLNGDDK